LHKHNMPWGECQGLKLWDGEIYTDIAFRRMDLSIGLLLLIHATELSWQRRGLKSLLIEICAFPWKTFSFHWLMPAKNMHRTKIVSSRPQNENQREPILVANVMPT